MIIIRSFLKSYFNFILSFIVLGVVTFISLERLAIMNNTMNDVFKIHVIALNKSSEIRRAYKDIAFRMAAYTSDVLPAAGSRNRLIEKKDIINKVQPLYFDLLKNISMEPKLSKKVIRMRAAISENNLFFEELDQAYEADNRKASDPISDHLASRRNLRTPCETCR